MPTVLTEELIYEILSAVEEIPEGKVASYGQIARLIGRDNNARLVGKVLSMAEYYGTYPCHRVVNHAGRLAPHFYEQKDLLLEENVEFKDEYHVNMKTCRWDCPDAEGKECFPFSMPEHFCTDTPAKFKF